MTSPGELNIGDKILLLKHGSRSEITGIQFSAVEHLRADQENVFEGRITSTLTYFGGYYKMDVRIDTINREIKGLNIRRDLLIERTFKQKK